MNWETNRGQIQYSASGYVLLDVTSPAKLGDEVAIKLNGDSFDIEVTSIAEGKFTGTVIRIGSDPMLESNGIKRGDEVSFLSSNIFNINRNDSA